MKKFLVGLLAALACFAMVACVPSDLAKAEEKMEEAGYIVKAYDLDAEGFVGGITATKGGSFGDIIGGVIDGDGFHAYLFETAADAKAYAEDKDDAEVSGKWVFWGSEEAVKAFKK